MTQTDSITSTVNQLLTQTRYSEQTASQDDGTTQFQDLMKEKSTVTSENTPNTAVKAEAKTDTQEKTEQPKEDPKEDPIVGEMAAADYAVAQMVVTLPELTQETEVSDAVQVTTVGLNVPEQVTEEAQTTEQPAAEEPVAQQPETQTAEEQAQPADTVTVTQTVPQAQQTEQPETQTGQQEESLPSDLVEDDDTTVTVTDAGADTAQPVFHDVAENMVKVGETASTEESQQAEDVNQQVAQQVTEGISQGETTVEVKLSPSSLGNVTVEVTAQEDGTMHIALSAENSHTKVLLEQHTASLQALVSSQTQRPVQVEVSQRQQQEQSTLQQDGQNGRSGYQRQQQKQQQQSSEDFLQKLRLGLVPLSAETEE